MDQSRRQSQSPYNESGMQRQPSSSSQQQQQRSYQMGGAPHYEEYTDYERIPQQSQKFTRGHETQHHQTQMHPAAAAHEAACSAHHAACAAHHAAATAHQQAAYRLSGISQPQQQQQQRSSKM